MDLVKDRVVTLHGIARGPRNMAGVSWFLRRQAFDPDAPPLLLTSSH